MSDGAEVLGSREALAKVAQAGLFILDIDGVLLDPRPSFYAAASETATWAATQILGRSPRTAVTADDIAAFKAVGGWNDDFDLACALAWGLIVREAGVDGLPVAQTAARVGGGLPALDQFLAHVVPAQLLTFGAELCEHRRIRERSAATYAGLERCLAMYDIDPSLHPSLPAKGLWPLEPELCDPALLRSVPVPLAIFTGRNRAEAGLALERFQLDIPADRQAFDDGVAPRKPAPDGLLKLAQGISGPLVFVGDSIDDQRAALAYRRVSGAEIVFVRVVETDAEAALAAGADLVVSRLDSLLMKVWRAQ